MIWRLAFYQPGVDSVECVYSRQLMKCSVVILTIMGLIECPCSHQQPAGGGETCCNFDNECVTLLICFEIYYKLKTPAIMAKLTMFKTLIWPLQVCAHNHPNNLDGDEF